jgi:glycosyltransferase involved in cell wall biosynthesis
MMKKNIFIYEPYLTGHHHDFLIYIMRLLSHYNIFLITSLDNKKKLSKIKKKNINIYYFNSKKIDKLKKYFLIKLFYQFLHWINCFFWQIRINKIKKIDYVIFTFYEYFYALTLIMPPPILHGKGILLLGWHGKFHLSHYIKTVKISKIETFLHNLIYQKILNNSKVDSIFVCDRLIYKYLTKYLKIKLNKIFLLPMKEASESFNKKIFFKNTFKKYLISKKKIILCYGSLSEKKQVLKLLNLFKFSNKINKNYQVILAGETYDPFLLSKILNFVKKNDNITHINRFITNIEENYLFKISYIVWLGGKRGVYTSSGVLDQSIYHNKPVIGLDNNVPAYFVKKYDIGKTFSDYNLADVEKKILKIDSDYKKIKFNLKKISKILLHKSINEENIFKNRFR